MMSKTTPSDRIIKTNNKRVEVLASPGSGKTHTLVERVLRLLTDKVSPEKILVLSFSNASVNELRHRMGKSITNLTIKSPKPSRGAPTASDLSNVTVSTAHAFAFGLVKRKTVLSGKKAYTLLTKAIRSAQHDCRKHDLWSDASQAVRRRRLEQLENLLEPSQVRMVLRLLEIARASKMTLSETTLMGQFEVLKRYANVLRAVRIRFLAIKKENGVVDYGDMLAQANKIIKARASVPFTHILVDEYQDCSAAQTHMLAQLAQLEGRSIMVFGDPHQAIFSFAGASYTPLSSVLDGVKKLSLPVSRRLTAQTAALASAVAQHSPKQAIQTCRDGDLPMLVQDKNLASQTKHIVRHIQQLIDRGTSPEQIVVLARIKALLHPVEQLLLAEKVQTMRMGANRHHKHALYALRLVRIVERCEKAKISVKPEMLQKPLRHLNVDNNLWERESLALNKVSRVPSLDGRYQLCAKIYLRLMGGIRNNPELRADINRWETSCRNYSNASAMLAAIRKMNPKAVVTGTIHSAKGGEWEHVLVVGVTDGHLPIYFARDIESLREERNLLYVAITRACKQVRLYHAPSSHARSRQQFDKISCFLRERTVHKTLRHVPRRKVAGS